MLLQFDEHVPLYDHIPNFQLSFYLELKKRFEHEIASGFTTIVLTTQQPADERTPVATNDGRYLYLLTEHDRKEIEVEIARCDDKIRQYELT